MVYLMLWHWRDISCNFVSHSKILALMAKEIFQIFWQDVSGTTGTPGDIRVDCQPGLGLHASSPVSDRFLRFTSRATPAELLVASISPESIRVQIQALSTVASTRNCRTASETQDISQRWIDLVEINQCLAHSLRLLSLLRENSSQGYSLQISVLGLADFPTFSLRYKLRRVEPDVLMDLCL